MRSRFAIPVLECARPKESGVDHWFFSRRFFSLTNSFCPGNENSGFYKVSILQHKVVWNEKGLLAKQPHIQ
jgi:hypothetical protein